MKELFDTAVTAPEPPLRPGFVEETLTRARRSRRLRRARAAMAAATCVLLVAAAVLWVRPLPRAAMPAQPWPSGPSLPDTFPPFNRLTASVADSPPGPAIALYQHGFSEAQHGFSEATVGLPEVQLVVAGAARDVYRQIDQVGPGEGHLLSPDGRRVLLHASLARELTLVDLETGASRRLPTVEWQGNVAADIALLAWSGDGRFVAYSVPADKPVDSPVPDPPIGHLALVELDTGRTRAYPDLGLVSAASFGPTGELALQIGETIVVATVDGYLVREVPVPLGHTLVPEVAWSPDGALLATNGPGGGSLAFIDATSSGRGVPRPVSGERVLGWRSPTSLLVFVGRRDNRPGGAGGTIEELSLTTGERTPISAFSDAEACYYWTRQCDVQSVRLATGLLPGLTVRPAGAADHGPWPVGLWVAIATLVASLALVGWRITRRLRRWARARRG